jgi:hypothetical protein
MNVLERAIYQFSDKCVRKVGLAADLTTVPGGANIFTIQNAPILVKNIFGVVTTIIGAGNAVPRLQHTPTGLAQVPLCAAAATIATDAVGTVYNITLVAAIVTLAPAAGLGVVLWDESYWGGANLILLPGIIAVTNAVSAVTGVIDWYIVYQPCEPSAFVIPL